MALERCKRFVDDYLARVPSSSPLDGDCELADLQQAYAFNVGEGHALRGERRIAYCYRTLSHQSFVDPIFFFFQDDRLRCVSSDFWSTDRLECAIELRRLGPPECRLDTDFRVTSFPRGEWVYPRLGLALTVIPETHLIAVRTAFAPCSIGEYRECYRNIETMREFAADHETSSTE